MLAKPKFRHWCLVFLLSAAGVPTVTTVTGCEQGESGPPDSPSHLESKRDGEDLVITWTAPNDSRLARFDLFRIVRNEDDSMYKRIAQIDAEKRKYVDKEVEVGKVYLYYMIAVTDDGEVSEPSRTLEVTFP